MNKNIKRIANAFIKKHKIKTVDYSVLKAVAADVGYTIIEFNGICNDKDVETIIQNLNIGDVINKSRGFTYASKECRLIFINEDLNDDEKILVLSHELGHIACEHLSTLPIIGKDVKDEYEANEFSHYLLEHNFYRKVKNIFNFHRVKIIATFVVLCICIGLITVYSINSNMNKYTDNLYITSTGTCYHEKDCIFVKNKTNARRLTVEEFEEGIYSPCDICLPD